MAMLFPGTFPQGCVPNSFTTLCTVSLGDDIVKADELVSIGRIVGTHGFRGTLKIMPLTDFPQRFKDLHEINLSQGTKVTRHKVLTCSPYKEMLLMKLEGIDDLETARLYRNALLGVEEQDVFALPPGYYYHFQLVGLAVFDVVKGYLGILREVLETGANDVYVIDSETYGEILIPAIKEVILEIDLIAQKMTVKLLEGLLDYGRKMAHAHPAVLIQYLLA